MTLSRNQIAVTIVAVIIAWAALDDITTDTSTNFWPERIALVACGVWFVFVAWRLIRARRPE